MSWLPRPTPQTPFKPDRPFTDEPRRSATSILYSFVKWRGAARGLYRVFNPAVYRFYRSNSGPPAETDSPYATSATLPNQPATTFANGTWRISVSYFNGILDSGFLPIGAHGETYRTLIIAAGVLKPTPPSQPYGFRIELRPGGIVRIIATYFSVADGTNAADQWAIAYTVNGVNPGPGAPSATPSISGAVSHLSYDLPAQTAGTVVKVLLQVRRAATVYSSPLGILSVTIPASGSSQVLSLATFPGALPATLQD